MADTRKTGTTAGAPPHFISRVARRIILRGALHGRISWFVALPLLAQIDRWAA